MSLKKVLTDDKNLQLVQDNVDYALTPLQASPLTGGNFLSGIALSTGNTVIAHKLGKQPTRWIVCDVTAASDIYRASWDANFITLNSSAVCTISLWVN